MRFAAGPRPIEAVRDVREPPARRPAVEREADALDRHVVIAVLRAQVPALVVGQRRHVHERKRLVGPMALPGAFGNILPAHAAPAYCSAPRWCHSGMVRCSVAADSCVHTSVVDAVLQSASCVVAKTAWPPAPGPVGGDQISCAPTESISKPYQSWSAAHIAFRSVSRPDRAWSRRSRCWRRARKRMPRAGVARSR
jgi:hypothetical protein